MNMSITKKIGCYLPYNLQFYGGGTVWTMYSINVNGSVLLKNGVHDLVVHEFNIGDEYVPLLRNLSDFGTFEESICDEEVNYLPIYGSDSEITKWARKIDWLLKNHYDIFGLIDAKKALDIKTIL